VGRCKGCFRKGTKGASVLLGHVLSGSGQVRYGSMRQSSTSLRMTTPQHHSDTLSRNLTRECYPVFSLPSSKIWGPEGFAPIPSSGELPCEGKLHKMYSYGVGFQIFLCFSNVLWNEGFYGGRSANPATNLLIRSN